MSDDLQFSGKCVYIFLEAIKKQRWFSFDNLNGVIFDRDTGLLWADLKYYNRNQLNVEKSRINTGIFKTGYVDDWKIPSYNQFRKMIEDKTFPCHQNNQENAGWTLFVKDDVNGKFWPWYVVNDGIVSTISLNESDNLSIVDNDNSLLLPCSEYFIKYSKYGKNVSSSNSDYTEKEHLMFTLKLFIEQHLIPVFDDIEITDLYKNVQSEFLLSSEFDYTKWLEKYDINAINCSVIKYFQAVQKWTQMLMNKLDFYETVNEKVINDFNGINLKLCKKYDSRDLLSEEENVLINDRQRYFASRFSLGMNNVKSKILAVKHQADELEYRIEEIDNGNDSIHQLALVEKEDRASFELVAENTVKIFRNALKKIECFESNHQYVIWAIGALETWNEKYKVFRTTYREEMKSSCDEDGIEEEIWQKWYKDWKSIRFRIEQKFQPVVEHELRQRIDMINEDEKTVAQQLVDKFEAYRNSVDMFYREERKSIYQSFAFQSGGDIQDKLESESKLYKLTADFQQALQSIVFNCAKAEDRIFILNWANDLLDIQIDDILEIISDNDLDSISETILTDFSNLKKKNYEIYLADAKSYVEEQASRDKQFNSLLFKIRKGLSTN